MTESIPSANGVLTREEAERALVSALGREVAKDIHDRIQASYEKRLAAANRAVSKAHMAQAAAEHNLMRAAGKREASQDRLVLAVRQLREKDAEIAELRELVDDLAAVIDGYRSDDGSRWTLAEIRERFGV
jgi:predicted  nucleic acid-binding Zn-ribbon protein